MDRAAYLTDMQICTCSQFKSRYNNSNNNKKETDYFQNFTRGYKLSIMLNATQVFRSAYTVDGTLKSQKNLIASHMDLVIIFALSRPARAYSDSRRKSRLWGCCDRDYFLLWPINYGKRLSISLTRRRRNPETWLYKTSTSSPTQKWTNPERRLYKTQGAQ